MATAPPFYLSDLDPPAKRAALSAALSLFAERGVDSVTIRDIAARSGYTNPALFRHFASKDALALALFETCYRRLLAAVQGGARKGGLRSVQTSLLALAGEAPEAVHYVLENLRRFFGQLPPELRATSILGEVRRLMAAERQAGRVGTQVDADLAAALFLGALAQITRMHQFDELGQSPVELDEKLWILLNEGLGS